MCAFQPDYRNLDLAARRVRPPRMPLYDHSIDLGIMERLAGKPIAGLLAADKADNAQGIRNMAEFFVRMGYDCMCYECCIIPWLPGGGCLRDEHHFPAIRTMEDFRRYPWEEIPDRFFDGCAFAYDALAEALPRGLGVVGGVGNGIVECVQDLTGYVNLCFLRYDDPELYRALFGRVSQLVYDIWARFLQRWSGLLTIARVGDDMGFKNSTLLPPADIAELAVPGYRRLAGLFHRYHKPFLLHSCGNIFPVMEDFISAGIDAKHSNEDAIAPLRQWLERYGDRIAIFGGIDVDAISRGTVSAIREQCKQIIRDCSLYPGFAFGTGNSVPGYVPADNYAAMIDTARKLRGE